MSVRPNYLYELDVVRFLAALLVAIFHLTWLVPETAGYMPIGWIGVQIFFVISGLVIANSANGRSVRSFVSGRALRLYPAAWCCGAISIAALAIFGSAHTEIGITAELSFHSVASSVVLLGERFLGGAYWTLPVELAFYGLVALVLLLGGFRHIQKVAIGLVLWALPYSVYMLVGAEGFELGYGPWNMTLVRHAAYFGFGILLWVWSQGNLSRWGIAAAMLSVPVAWVEIADRAAEIESIVGQPDLAPWAFAVWMIAVAVIARSAKRTLIRSEPVRSAVRTAGLMTYPFYLLHEALAGSIAGSLQGTSIGTPGAVTIALVLNAGASYAVIKGLEPPVRHRLGKAIKARAMASPPAALPP